MSNYLQYIVQASLIQYNRVMNVKRLWITVGLLTLILVLFVVYRTEKIENKFLSVSMLSVGQGDALFVQTPTGTQMLIDGGPDTTLLRELDAVMPYGDRSIDVVVITNPDKDHYAGIIPLLREYAVSLVVEPGTMSDTDTYKTLSQMLKDENIPTLIARKGLRIVLDKIHAIEFSVLFPDRDVATWTTNDGSIVGKLTYGATSFMMTGDATQKTENLIISGNPLETLKSTVLKVGHHGSNTSTGDAWVRAVAPEIAIISAGSTNRYGHPHKETLHTLEKYSVRVFGTYSSGRIQLFSDGSRVWK